MSEENEPKEVATREDDEVEPTDFGGEDDNEGNEHENAVAADPNAGLSKNAIKRNLRRQRMKQKWREEREREKRVRREHKEKITKIVEEAKAAGVKPDFSQVQTPKEVLKKHRKQRFRADDMVLTDQKIVVDMQFHELMLEKELSSLRKQIMYIHAFNRRNPKPVHVHLTSVNSKQKEELVQIYADRWKGIYIEEKPYLDLFPKENLVYLTADSDNVVEAFEDDKIYIIGGLVDHNRYKGKCEEIATSQGIKTARLPIDEYVKLETRRVLTVNQVFEILLNVRINGGNWKEAFLQSIPARKGVSERTDENQEDEDEADEDDYQENEETAKLDEESHSSPE